MTNPFPPTPTLDGYYAPPGMECDAQDLMIQDEVPRDLNECTSATGRTRFILHRMDGSNNASPDKIADTGSMYAPAYLAARTRGISFERV